MLADRSTLTQFLIEERRRYPDASGDLNALILDAALACKAIGKQAAYGALGGVVGAAVSVGTQPESERRLPRLANELFRRANEWGGHLSGMVSEEMERPCAIPAQYPRGKYLLVFDALDGSSRLDVNVCVGSIFAILRGPHAGEDATTDDFLQAGCEQVCAGYAIYGPATIFVITVGTGVHGFTLDPQIGEFFLTHPSIQIPPATCEFAIDASGSRHWEPAVKRYIDECLAGEAGPRGKDFSMRWIASLVAETHHILLRGGVCMYPCNVRDPAQRSQVQLLYKANPIAFIIEQAGGCASTGRERVLEVAPKDLRQRVGFIFGSREEVERIDRYHRDHGLHDYDSPLFRVRGLFRAPR
jgi:fructose-1,6-bisphosphatase I/sedoheptulose-1,7-bisphosphatase